MNSNMRAFSSNVEEKLNRAYKAGNYAKKFGFEGMSTKNMDEDLETKSQISGGAPGNMTAFEKILHKDNNKLNRLQTQARNYIGGSASFDGNRSAMSSHERIPKTSLPALTNDRIGGGRLASARSVGAAGYGNEFRASTGQPGSTKNRALSGKGSVTSFK